MKILTISKITLIIGLSLMATSRVLATSNHLQSDAGSDAIDEQLHQLISQYKLTGKPESSHPIPDIKSPLAQLGKKLFFSKTLGGDQTTACASCHHPLLGGGDQLSLSIGIDAKNPDLLGNHRQLQNNQAPRVPRNAPTTFNVAFWKRVMFHDMRIERLPDNSIHTPDMAYPQADALAGETLVQAQARFPITATDEMRNSYMAGAYNQTLRRALAERLKKNWLDEFRHGFSYPEGSVNELITEQNFSEAIAAYERSQVFINNPWKAYIEGDKTAISADAKKGALLFYSKRENGGADCVQCHQGDFFTDERAYNTAIPQIGKGKHNGSSKTNDFGCYLVTKKEQDKFRFRTPTLLNVEVTGPWGHDGAYTSLEGVVAHMLNPLKGASDYDPSQLTQKNIHVTDLEENTREAILAGIDIVAKPTINKNDIKYLVAFLKTLTDPCVKDANCLADWMPQANENDPDGKILHAVIKSPVQ